MVKGNPVLAVAGRQPAIEMLTALIAEAEQVLSQRVRGAPSDGYSRQAIADGLRTAFGE